MFFFCKHNDNKHIQPGISEKNKHMLRILFSLENSCFLHFSCLESYSEVFSEICQNSKMKFVPKIVIALWPLKNFTKNFILEFWQDFDYDSVILSKAAGLQSLAYNFTKRWTSSQIFFKDFEIWRNTSGRCFQRDRCYKKCF